MEAFDRSPVGEGWIAERLGGSFGAVTRCVPYGYAAYVRLFHPARDAGGTSVPWAEVASRMGREAHPLMQWRALVGADLRSGTGSHWQGLNPRLGDVERDLSATL